MTLFRPFQMTVTEPVVIAANLYIVSGGDAECRRLLTAFVSQGFIYAVLYAWFEVFPLT